MSVFAKYLEGSQRRQLNDQWHAAQRGKNPISGMMEMPQTPMSEYMTASKAAEGVTAEAQAALDRLQQAWGRPLRITSAYRSPEHNARVGGAKHSKHMHGEAFDVDVSELSLAERQQLIELGRQHGFGGIGVYDNSLHFDIGAQRAWGPSYGRESLPEWAYTAIGTPKGTWRPG